MAGSSVAAMVVGTVFIMIFGMATVSLVDTVNESAKITNFELSDPEVLLVSVTDKEESTGPGESVSLVSGGGDYADGARCGVTASTGSGMQVDVSANGINVVTGIAVTAGSEGSGYTDGDTITINCGGGNATGTLDIHDQNVITIRNSGSETVDLSHISITLSDTSPVVQGTPFLFTDYYSGSNLYLFPGGELSTDAFPLSSTSHGFSMGDDPDRAFLAIYNHNDAVSVTIT